MINWNEMNGLHVISKLEQILGRWFGVEMIYTDLHSKIRSRQLERDYEFKNHFMKVQMEMNYGHEYVAQDIEKTTDLLSSSGDHTVEFNSFFDHVKGFSSKVEVEGEYLGTVSAYPFIHDIVTHEEIETIKAKMIECGADK
ncbi:MAG: hypothetical protein KAG61_02095, partial [Bacteriovoracaceae bacterium]|nr:hypothetical protein [Bacteriovoracaceae bacterium]